MATEKKFTIEFSKTELQTICNAILNFALPAYAQDLRRHTAALKKWDGKGKAPKMPIQLNADKAKDIAKFLERQYR